jgi:hypothetical protein
MDSNNNKHAQMQQKLKQENTQVPVTPQPAAEPFMPGIDDPVEVMLTTADTGFVPVFEPVFESGEAVTDSTEADMAAQNNGSFPRLHSAFQYPYL